jgi:hypothetical protein
MHVYWLVAFIFGATAAAIARGKGRSGLGWFLGGLLIGPFALVVAALPPTIREGTWTQCPACHEVIRSGATLCRYCHTIIDEPT